MLFSNMDGFKQVTFGKTPSRKEIVSKRRNSAGEKKTLKIIGTVLAAFLILIVIFLAALIIPGRNLYFAVQKSANSAKEAYSAIKSRDIASSQAKLTELESNLENVNSQLSKVSWVGYVPFLGSYEKDFQHMVTGGIAGVQAAQITVTTLVPYADLLGLKGKSSFVSGSADDRIKLAVETLDKVTPKLSDIAAKINITGNELDQIDPNRYPEQFGSLPVRGRIVAAKNLFSATAKLFVDAQPFLKELPTLLGNKDPKTYMVLFQNDAELRATGGFITGYALFKVDKGKMQVIKADDIYKLDAAKTKTFPAPPPILKYHINVNTLELRDSNLSPDYVVSMQKFENMLKDSVPDLPPFDGIVAVDTHVLVDAIKILGDFNIAGRQFSAQNDPRCDCPKAIYELEDYSAKPLATFNTERKDIIGVLLYQIMQRALGVSPSKYWGQLMEMFLTEAQQKHVLFYFHNQEAQKGIEALNFAGRIVAFDGDYLHISNVNFAGAKSNLFVKFSVKQEITVSDNGSVAETVTINYKNPSPPSNCNLEAGQLCLNGILRNWLRFYVPSGSKLTSFVGSEKTTSTYDELSKTVFEGFMTVKPEGAAQVVVKYNLPFKVKKGDLYKLLIQKQPGTDNPQYTIYYNGKQIDQFFLLTDKTVTFQL